MILCGVGALQEGVIKGHLHPQHGMLKLGNSQAPFSSVASSHPSVITMLAPNSLSFSLLLLLFYATFAHAFDISQFLSGHSHDTHELWTGLAPAWVSSPNARGTGDILFSCLATLVACAYTAVHPIIPPGGESTRSFTIIKYLLVFVAVVAPEAVVAFAVQECYDAWRLKRKLQEIIEKKPCPHHKKQGPNQPRVSIRNMEKVCLSPLTISQRTRRPTVQSMILTGVLKRKQSAQSPILMCQRRSI